jgi:sulfofructose kinase
VPFQNSTEIPVADVTGVGLNATDTLIELPHFPARDSKVEIRRTTRLAGGQVASAMAACRFWGLKARYVGKVGDDDAGNFQRRELERAGVEAHWITAPGCASQAAYILLDGSGERTILWRREPRIALLPSDLDRAWVTQSRALLVDGHDTAAATAAARWAREAGIPVVADVDNIYPGLEGLLEKVDYLFSSGSFPARCTGQKNILQALLELSRRFRFKITGATLGSGGCIAWDGSCFHYAPAFRVNAIDTTGAGDIFHAAFVYSLLAGEALHEQLDFSCAAAGLNCTAVGARSGIKPLEEIRQLMANGQRHAALFAKRQFSELEARKFSKATASRRSPATKPRKKTAKMKISRTGKP